MIEEGEGEKGIKGEGVIEREKGRMGEEAMGRVQSLSH